MLEWRLGAYRRWLNMTEPKWARIGYPPIDFQDLYYYAAPKTGNANPKSLDEVDPELLRTYENLAFLFRAADAGGRRGGRRVRFRLRSHHVQGQT